MTDIKKATVEDYEQHVCTECYHPFDGNYALTDGIKWLGDHLPSDIFLNMLCDIRDHMSYKLPFGFFTLNIDDNGIYLITTDGNGNNLCKNVLSTKKDDPDIKLADGIYKVWCYNYVILAASEY